MSPERKAKIIKWVLGLLAALGATFVAYVSANWTDLVSQIPFGLAAGFAAGLTAKLL